MAKTKPTTKQCKYCKTEIPYDAKVCPQCRKKLKGGKLKWIIIAIVVLAIIGSMNGGKSGEEKSTQKIGEVTKNNTSTATTAAADNTPTTYKVGDILKDGNLEIVYMSSGEWVSDNQFVKPADGNKYIYIQLAFENKSTSQDAGVSMFSFNCFADGYHAEMYYGGENTLSSTLSAGRSTSGYLYFEVPANAKEIEIEYEPNFLSQKKLTFVYEGEADSGYVVEAKAVATDGALKVGESSESKSLKVTYLDCYRDSSNNAFITPKAGYHYVTCEFEFENVSNSDQAVSMFSFDCFADGIDCEGAYFRNDGLSATMSAGRKAKGTVTFEVPDNAQVVEVEYLSNFWTSNRVVFSANK